MAREHERRIEELHTYLEQEAEEARRCSEDLRAAKDPGAEAQAERMDDLAQHQIPPVQAGLTHASRDDVGVREAAQHAYQHLDATGELVELPEDAVQGLTKKKREELKARYQELRQVRVQIERWAREHGDTVAGLVRESREIADAAAVEEAGPLILHLKDAQQLVDRRLKPNRHQIGQLTGNWQRAVNEWQELLREVFTESSRDQEQQRGRVRAAFAVLFVNELLARLHGYLQAVETAAGTAVAVASGERGA